MHPVSFNPPTLTERDLTEAASLLNIDQNLLFSESRREAATRMDSFDVAACPGSGKTTLLVAKLAMLSRNWPHSTRGLCVLSHTNVARGEIEASLGNSAHGRRLLSAPHYVGTIHGFVNEFLALPWLRAKGYPIRVIDNDVVLLRRWKALNHNTRLGLEKSKHDLKVMTIKSADFGVGRVKWGKGMLGLNTPTYQELQKICRISTSRGFVCHDEMFVWANELLNQSSTVTNFLRYRFPLVFIDEAQDNSEEQSAILQRLFLDGAEPASCQRFGDENQAIFDSLQVEAANTNPFPNRQQTIELANSHRFGQSIARLVTPFAAVPLTLGLRGNGPRRALKSGEDKGPHTIFLIDEHSTRRVLASYGDLLVRTFSVDELSRGNFFAVAQIHRQPPEEQTHKHPHHLCHYWPHYNPAFSKSEPTPSVFVQYVLVGVSKASLQGECAVAVERLAEGILRLSGEGKKDLSIRKYKHRQVLELLQHTEAIRKKYEDFIVTFALHRECLSEESWLGKWRAIVLEIAEAISQTRLVAPAVEPFLVWDDSAALTFGRMTDAPISVDNIYRYPAGDPLVNIQLGSVHSVKGQTHTATLVLETFWKAHNLERLQPWLLGEKIGCTNRESEDQKKRMKLHYVAMTRPTHLLCLALKRKMLEDGRGKLAPERVQALRQRGWEIDDLTTQLPLFAKR
jgi:DNA helicase-2/ATP-dependent DNA helicase PcrA